MINNAVEKNELDRLKAELSRLQRENEDLQIALLTSNEHGDLLQEHLFKLSTIRDVTERKQVEQQILNLNRQLEETASLAQAANRAKSTFLSTMSHEIRTPMNAILGFAQLLLRDPGLGPDAIGNVKIICQSGGHLLDLINDVLDMSKIEAGHFHLSPVVFNLSKFFDDLVKTFRIRAEAKALQLGMLFDRPSVTYVMADEGKIRQALINLLGNAIKFTQRGRITLQITVDPRTGERPWLVVRIADTGSGIADEDREKLFEPFSRGKGELNTQEGTGLGLAITRQYARSMGGDVTVSSNPGGGSIFLFEIPIERADAGVAINRVDPRRVVAIRAGTTTPRILVVDDQMENRDWLTQLLTLVGFSVKSATDGERAIRVWEEWNPQLILMDVHMPVMDGLEATRRIKMDPRGRGTIVVALTASAMDDDRNAASQSGANDFISKPCREDELLETMRGLLSIEYDYEEILGTEHQALAGRAPVCAERLGQLPSELIHELRNATVAGNKKLLDHLIVKVGVTGDAESAQGLQELADEYEYDALKQLLEKAGLRTA